ncbi:Efflux pump periplasmic linker BepD precursor [Gemmata sp. SH-PL17]|uniref:efflux RND transporter periplasmic adaptor subunit n=1 Tax=Gemmata sp. SH-PL17 TaxID=1630693 RepID=UPI00078DCEF6|nr:efflux RND transporter periplasmic adaptor subunit [Gemmata sp. SH-PL17]AMV26233.1 Efflux pump periplasmic linker BepD precursor [Gemmata sp. SH-PL17]
MRRDLSFVLTAALGLTPAVGCNQKSTPPGGAAPAPATPITVIKPERRAIKRVIEQPGTATAFEETVLHAKLPGFVGRIADDPEKANRPPHDRQTDIGSRVKAGQILAVLTMPELDEEWKQKVALVKQAEAEVVQSEKAAEAMKAGVTAAESLVTVAEAGVDRSQALYERWQKEVDRIAKLLGNGVGDSQTLDETKNQLRAAEAGQKEATARVTAARAAVKKAVADEAKVVADVVGARAKLEVARAEVNRLDALRSYTAIKAPFDGVVTRRSVNTGDLVSGTEKTGLFAVARTDPVRVVVNVPEADAGQVAVGQDVRLALQGPEQVGKVVRTSWSLEPGSRTLRTEIDLPNEVGALRPGMFVHAKLTIELPAAWSVPAAAVGKSGDDAVMYAVEGGKAARVTVQLIKGDGQFTQVRRYKKSAATDWTDVTGSEQFASPAAALTDGQAIP